MRQYVDFLGGQAPYDALNSDDLERLAHHVEVEYASAGTEIVAADGPVLGHLYVVRKGTVEVVDRGRVVDQLDSGDTFGHISVLSGLPPPFAVRAIEDTLLYRIPDPRGLLLHPERLRFSHYGSLVARNRLTRDRLFAADQLPLSDGMRPVLWCHPSATVREAAALITKGRQSSALVPTAAGFGIITDSDIRRCVGDRSRSLDGPATDLATVPAFTVSPRTSRARAFATMIEHGVHHLVVVNEREQPVGVVRVIDLASADLRDPLLIRGAIAASDSLDELVEAAGSLPATALELVDAGLPAVRTGTLLAAVREALLRKVVQLTGDDDHAWLLLGSTARREPLPSSDIDTAIAWRDVSTDDPTGEETRRRCAERHAHHVLDQLERCGLQRCPDGVNATDPRFGRSVRGWGRAYEAWQATPVVQDPMLLTSMLADARPITALAVARAVGGLAQPPHPSHALLSRVLRWAVSLRPPSGFVREFVVEHTGEHRGQLDLKRGGLMPIVAIGQWISVVTGEGTGSTPERLRQGFNASLLTKDDADSLEGAFELIYGHLVEQDATQLRSGSAPSRFVDPAEVDPLTRRHLRSAFREVSRVQAQLERDWATRKPTGC